jgi:hypothetical protein
LDQEPKAVALQVLGQPGTRCQPARRLPNT